MSGYGMYGFTNGLMDGANFAMGLTKKYDDLKDARANRNAAATRAEEEAAAAERQRKEREAQYFGVSVHPKHINKFGDSMLTNNLVANALRDKYQVDKQPYENLWGAAQQEPQVGEVQQPVMPVGMVGRGAQNG